MATKTKSKKTTTIPGLSGLDLSGLTPDQLTSINATNTIAYGPQLNQIRDLFKQAKTQYAQDRQAAHSNADSARMYAQKAIPEVKQIFDNAATAAQAGTDTANQTMDKFGATATDDPFRRALAREQQAATDRITNEGAKAQQGLQDRITAAESGRQYALAAAKKTYRTNKDTLSQKLMDVLQEQGAATGKAAADIRTSNASAQAKADADAAKQAAKDKAAADKAAAENKKRIAGVRTTTGAYQNKIADATNDWRLYAKQGLPVMVADPNNAGKQIQATYSSDDIDALKARDKKGVARDPFGKPVKEGDLKVSKPTPSELKTYLSTQLRDADGHVKYTPGDLHVMLLVSQGKPLDAEAKAYLRGLHAKGVRIPSAWRISEASLGGRPPGYTGPGASSR